MIRRLAALFLLGIRAPLRSRLVTVLLVLLGAVVILLPIAIKGDGTPAGDVRMLLTWTLGMAFGILCAASIWSGCSAVSTDIEEGRHVLTAVSPARPFEIWLGRWLGILFINAVLLGVVVAAVSVQLRIRGLSAEDTAVYRRLALEKSAVRDEVRAIFDQAVRMGAIPADAPAEEVQRAIRKDFEEAYLSVDPGAERRWVFELKPGDGDREIRLDFSFLSASGALSGGRGICTVATETGKVVARRELEDEAVGGLEMALPPGTLAGEARAHVVFRNTGDAAHGVSVLVSHFESMELLVRDGGVVRNLITCSLAMFSLLALLSALGVACGTLFSFPVATFAGSAVVLMLFVGSSGMVEEGVGHGHSHGEDTPPSAFSEAMDGFSKRLAVCVSSVSKPFSDTQALDRLGDGILIEPRRVARALVLTGGVVPLVLGMLAAAVLKRREL